MTNLIKKPQQIAKIRKSGQILAETLRQLSREVRPGVTSMGLDAIAREAIEACGARPAFLGYKPSGAVHPFPYSLCASVNDTVVHGRPTDKPLEDGDIIKLDLGVDWNGGISDAAITLPVGRISERDRTLLKVTERALREAIKAIRPGATLGDVGYAVENVVTKGGGFVMDGLTGHGVGEKVHEEPTVYNFGEPGDGLTLQPGMVIAIEPMVSLSTHEVRQLADDSFITLDGSNSAHFEHTILITPRGADILTDHKVIVV